MYFSAKLFALQDDKVVYLEGKLYDDEGEALWDEMEEYENQLKAHMESFIYYKKLTPEERENNVGRHY